MRGLRNCGSVCLFLFQQGMPVLRLRMLRLWMRAVIPHTCCDYVCCWMLSYPIRGHHTLRLFLCQRPLCIWEEARPRPRARSQAARANGERETSCPERTFATVQQNAPLAPLHGRAPIAPHEGDPNKKSAHDESCMTLRSRLQVRGDPCVNIDFATGASADWVNILLRAVGGEDLLKRLAAAGRGAEAHDPTPLLRGPLARYKLARQG